MSNPVPTISRRDFWRTLFTPKRREFSPENEVPFWESPDYRALLLHDGAKPYTNITSPIGVEVWQFGDHQSQLPSPQELEERINKLQQILGSNVTLPSNLMPVIITGMPHNEIYWRNSPNTEHSPQTRLQNFVHWNHGGVTPFNSSLRANNYRTSPYMRLEYAKDSNGRARAIILPPDIENYCTNNINDESIPVSFRQGTDYRLPDLHSYYTFMLLFALTNLSENAQPEQGFRSYFVDTIKDETWNSLVVDICGGSLIPEGSYNSIRIDNCTVSEPQG